MTCLLKQYLPSVQFGGIVHFLQDQQVIASKGNTVFFSENGGSEWKKLLSFPLSLCDQLKCSNKISRRLFRSGVQHAIGINDNVFVFWAFGGIYNYVLKSNTLMRSITSFPGSRPLSLCHAGGGKLYFGEYRGNPERSPVHIFGSIDSGKVWRPVWEFASIRHVHGVFHDPYTNQIWVTTGDEDQECGLWVTTDHFQTIEKVVGGTQQARAVQLLFSYDFIYFGSDTPLEQNWIYRLSRKDLRIERLQMVEGSIFYGCKVGTKLFFSSVCEPSKINRSRVAVIWESSNGVTWQRFLDFPKDTLPMKLFQYGQIRFPAGTGDNKSLWITPFATDNDQQSMRFLLQDASNGI